jgi:hypothetical protein
MSIIEIERNRWRGVYTIHSGVQSPLLRSGCSAQKTFLEADRPWLKATRQCSLHVGHWPGLEGGPPFYPSVTVSRRRLCWAGYPMNIAW